MTFGTRGLNEPNYANPINLQHGLSIDNYTMNISGVSSVQKAAKISPIKEVPLLTRS